MARPQAKVKRIDITDWRQSFMVGTLVGIVVIAAPVMFTTIGMIGALILIIKLVELGRL